MCMQAVGLALELERFKDKFGIVFAYGIAVARVVIVLLELIVLDDFRDGAGELGVVLCEPVKIAGVLFDDGPNGLPAALREVFRRNDRELVLSNNVGDVCFAIFN